MVPEYSGSGPARSRSWPKIKEIWNFLPDIPDPSKDPYGFLRSPLQDIIKYRSLTVDPMYQKKRGRSKRSGKVEGSGSKIDKKLSFKVLDAEQKGKSNDYIFENLLGIRLPRKGTKKYRVVYLKAYAQKRRLLDHASKIPNKNT